MAASQITGSQIKNSTITSKDVKNRSLKTADMSRGMTRSFRGARGPQGAQGPPGPTNTSALTPVSSGEFIVAPGDVDGVTVNCPAGMNVVSGGYTSASADGEVFVSDSLTSRTSWTALLDNFDSSIAGQVEATALCSGAGAAVVAKARPRAARATGLRSRARAAVSAQKALHH